MAKIYNNKDELRKAIIKKIGGGFSDEVWEEFQPLWDSPYDNSDVNEITNDMRNKGIEINEKQTNIVSAAALRSKIRARELEPWIRSDREHLFGDKNPPFDDLSEMEQWLLSEATKEQEQFSNDNKIKEELAYQPPDGRRMEYINIWEGSLLYKLWNLSKIRAHDLGCKESQALAYILTGKIPFVAPIAYSFTGRSKARTPSLGEITITIREPVPEEQITHLYRILRRNVWGRFQNSKSINERDIKIVDFVEGYTRGIIVEGNPRSWSQLLVEWNRNYPDWNFSYEDAFRMAFKRAFAKVYPGVDWDGLYGHR